MDFQGDRRVRRTHAALREALLELMAEKGFEAVTVQDLIDRANVGRSTFYAHFTDKADLLSDTLAEMRQIVEAAVPADGLDDRRRPLRFSLDMLLHVHERQELLRALLCGPTVSSVVGHLEATLRDMVRRDLAALMPSPGRPKVPLGLLERSVVNSFLATMIWWAQQDFEKTPEQVDAMFQTMIAPGVLAALRPDTG